MYKVIVLKYHYCCIGHFQPQQWRMRSQLLQCVTGLRELRFPDSHLFIKFLLFILERKNLNQNVKFGLIIGHALILFPFFWIQKTKNEKTKLFFCFENKKWTVEHVHPPRTHPKFTYISIIKAVRPYLFHTCITTYLFLLVSLSYFILAVHMQEHLCMSSTFPIAILNGAFFFFFLCDFFSLYFSLYLFPLLQNSNKLCLLLLYSD